MSMLDSRPTPPADLLVRGAHVLDPRAGIDAPHDVLVRAGVIAEIGAPGSLEAPDGAEAIDGEGRHLFPGFVDPHVHLRVPGQEHKEDLDSGTRASRRACSRSDSSTGAESTTGSVFGMATTAT